MFLRHRKNAIAILIGLAASTAAAQAGDTLIQSDWRNVHVPSITRWGDTYAGNASAVSFRNGTYFYIDRRSQAHDLPQEKRQKARILDARQTHCTYEAGVCVIRP